jgi:hypothetical protein
MVGLVPAIAFYFRCLVVTRHRLALESAALRQQLAVYKRKHPRPRLQRLDRLFWVALRRFWSGWSDALIIVQPKTVVSWHRAGFRVFWRWRSRQSGRPKINKEVRELIRRMKVDNPTWGAPRIHGELLQLGFEIPSDHVRRRDVRQSRASPTDPDHLPCMPCSLPRWIGSGVCWSLPCPRGLPRSSGGSASTSQLSRPAQASLALRPARLLTHHTWALSRGSALAGFPARTLASYQVLPTTT